MDRIAHYRIDRKLGEGGMGVVYAAHDERLDRPVAIKMIRQEIAGEDARRCFWREARAAAAVNHPNVCQLYEIGEHQGQLYLVMELLQGESLAERLKRGPVAAGETIQIALGILAALEALHRKEIVHRDLKPTNVFLTEHAVKVLDFGLARTATGAADAKTITELSVTGAIVGTPHYMSPEQVEGRALGPASDLFSTGAILHEMLSGRRAFGGDSAVAVFHAVLYTQPPALSGSPAVSALDRILRRALEKKPGDRYPDAASMAQALRAVGAEPGPPAVTAARRVTRLMALPFRMLRPDAETDFLAFSLPDDVTASLSGLGSRVVRSSLAAAKFAGAALDLKAIAAEAEVDAVLVGTLLRAGEQLRVSTQLVETPAGTVLWSQTSQVALRDIFQVT